MALGVFSARDLRAFFSTGRPVSFQGVSTYPDGVTIRGNVDRPVQMKLGEGGFGAVETACPQITLPVNAFNPMPQDGDSILVDGTTYTVTQPTAEDDGAFLVYELLLTE